MRLKNTVALITGGSRGIGRAISLALARKGCRVIINYHKDKQSAEETKALVEQLGAHAYLLQFDVTQRDEVRSSLASLPRDLRDIRILVNNAGILGEKYRFMEIDDDEWERVMDVNVKGAFIVTQEVLRFMRRGKIVNIASIAGRNGGTVGAHYAASKAALIGFTFALARQLAPDILVNAVAPGPVDTTLIPEEKKSELAKLSPLNRIATPEEIAHAVQFLLENDYVTGSVVDVNGGRYML